jgi:CheY-like chemotaxis protein
MIAFARTHPTRTALVVDDEQVVRLVLRRYLGRVGWRVVEAEPAERALELLAGGAAPDIVVCDRTLPGLSGAELCQRIAELHPALATRLVVTSGDAASAAAELEAASLDRPVLGKPFALAELQHLVDTVAPTD